MKLKFDPYQFNKTNSNGVPIYWKNIPWANNFLYIHVIIKIGAQNDPIGKEGLAHFLEHMPFDGCRHHPTFEKIEKTNHEIFNDTLNAHTNFEQTNYEGCVSRDKLETALEFFRNFIFFPVLNPAEVERERKIITQEIWRKYANQKMADFEKSCRKMIYGEHPFGKMGIAFGWHDSVAKVSTKDLASFHQENYIAENMQIVMIGDIDQAGIESVSLLTRDIPVAGFPWKAPKKNIILGESYA